MKNKNIDTSMYILINTCHIYIFFSLSFRPNFVPNSMKVVKMSCKKDITGKVENQLIILHSERLIISPKHLFAFHLKEKIIISSNKSNTHPLYIFYVQFAA